MKLSPILLALPPAIADFWMVYQRRYAQYGHAEFTSYGMSFVSDEPKWSCERDAFGHYIFVDRRNVSNHFDLTFEPMNDKPGPLWHDPLDTVNINLTSFGIERQTISRGENGSFVMVDADNVKTGECFENRMFILDLDCWWQHPDTRVNAYHVNVNGSSMFFCQSDIEVDDPGAILKSVLGPWAVWSGGLHS